MKVKTAKTDQALCGTCVGDDHKEVLSNIKLGKKNLEIVGIF